MSTLTSYKLHPPIPDVPDAQASAHKVNSCLAKSAWCSEPLLFHVDGCNAEADGAPQAELLHRLCPACASASAAFRASAWSLTVGSNGAEASGLDSHFATNMAAEYRLSAQHELPGIRKIGTLMVLLKLRVLASPCMALALPHVR